MPGPYRETFTTLWGASVPVTAPVAESSPVWLVMRLGVDVDSYAMGFRYYQAAADAGDHFGVLYGAPSGRPVRQAPSVRNNHGAPAASGWQNTYWRDWVSLAAGAQFYIGVWFTAGYYSKTEYGLTTDMINGHIRALADGAGGLANGTYTYGDTPLSVPTNTYHSTAYGIDAIVRVK